MILSFTCPRKLALKTMSIKVREVYPAPRIPLSHAIGISGERLTEEILEIIANIQADSLKGEYVEVFKGRSKSVGESRSSERGVRIDGGKPSYIN